GLEVLDQRVFLEDGEALGHRHRVRRDVEHLRAIDAGEADQIAAALRLFTLLVEPDAELRSAGDLFADRMNVLIPRDLLARDDQFAGARTVEVVALADRPLHQLRAAVDEIRV